MASHTVSFVIMLACTDQPSPLRWPASAMQLLPVWTATLPEASTTATWRCSRPSSPATSWARASAAVAPSRNSARASGP